MKSWFRNQAFAGIIHTSPSCGASVLYRNVSSRN